MLSYRLSHEPLRNKIWLLINVAAAALGWGFFLLAYVFSRSKRSFLLFQILSALLKLHPTLFSPLV